MFSRFTRRTWLIIGGSLAAVVIAVALVLAVGGDDGDSADVATATSTTAPRSTTTGDTTAASEAGTTTTGDGGPTTTTCAPPAAEVELLAEVDLDGDGTDEVFVRTGTGGPRDVARLLRRNGCELVPVTVDGAPADFPIGASLRVTGGLRCDPSAGTVVVYSGESDDGESYDITWRELRLDGSVLVEIRTGSGTARVGDELQVAASTFACAR